MALVGTKESRAAGELNKFRGRDYVAACPPVKESIPRTPGPQRVMVIGAHPDDADIQCGCTAAKLIAKGARVKFVAVCNGNIGHHKLDRKETAAARGSGTTDRLTSDRVRGDCVMLDPSARRLRVGLQVG